MNKALSIILLSTFFLGACSTTAGRTLGGGAIGAGSGAAIGAAFGSPATGAAIGGGAGLLGGYIYDQYEKSRTNP